MLPSNLNESVEKTVEFNYEILISIIDMKIGSSKDISKFYKNIWCFSKVMRAQILQ